MAKPARPVVALIITGLLLVTQLARPARSDDRPIRLYARAGRGPIGSIDLWSRVSINGREQRGGTLLWGGELIEARAGNAHVSIDGLAEVSLARGSMVRLAKAVNTFDERGGDLLVATIIDGAASMRLDQRSGAYLEAGGASYLASRGAHFQIRLQASQADFSVAAGEVQQVQASPQRNYKIRPIGLGATLSVRARATRQIQVQVTDENDRPVPDVPVLFALGAGGGGSLGGGAAIATSITVTTNAQGIATTTFTAGLTPSTTSITASIPGTNVSFTTAVTINAAAGLLSTTTITLLAAAGGAAAAGVAVAVNKKDNKEDIKAQPPDVRPK
jgi:hypothetical protein